MFLVVGCNGQLGNELKLLLKDKAVYVDKEELDITDKQAVSNFVAGKNFEAIINCAAYTAVDKAESDEKLAELINVEGPRNLAATGVPLVHISTDYVFDGTNSKPYVEEDVPNPQTAYGRTKLAGEKAVMETAKTAVIIRTAWLYSIFGNNFVKTMRKLGAEREKLNVVFDQIGTPTYAGDLAKAIVTILPKMKEGIKELYHFSNEGVCSWYDFALAIMAQSDLNCQVFPIESKEYPTPAKRPHYSVLNKAKIKKDFNLVINHWAISLAECVEKMNNGL
ncbi:MAG: dTDP-4-dehydrorhamnose reductase [Alphaproteobacteria bacterium]|nr:dTDP-4-dehydrorhamnose reductase [Alphaproteobacteria bacterium]